MVVESKAIGADKSEEMVRRGLNTFSGMYDIALEQWFLRVNRREDGKARSSLLPGKAKKALAKVSASVKASVKPGMSVKRCWGLWKAAAAEAFSGEEYKSLYDSKWGELKRANAQLDAYFRAASDGATEGLMRDLDRLRMILEAADKSVTRVRILAQAQSVEVWDKDRLVMDSEKTDFPFEPNWKDLPGLVKRCQKAWPKAKVELNESFESDTLNQLLDMEVEPSLTEEGVSADGSAMIVLKLDSEWKKTQKALVVVVTKGLAAVNAWAKQQGLKFKKAANLFGGEYVDGEGNFYVAYPKMLKDGAAEGGRVAWAEDEDREPANLDEASVPQKSEEAFIAPMAKVTGTKFKLGRTVMTAGVNAEIQDTPALGGWVAQCLQRHAKGDWGDIDKEDEGENDKALQSGGRLFSVYKKGRVKIWIITEADRSSTTVLFPDEY